jgi:hypothetical protein
VCFAQYGLPTSRYSCVRKVLKDRLIAGQIQEETLKNDVFWHAQFCVCARACVRDSRMNLALIDVAADGVCQQAVALPT